MRVMPLSAVYAILLAVAFLPCAAEQAYLTATFDDKAVDSPIGTGGPDVATSPGMVATYATGRPYPVMIAFDQGTRTYSIWLDGVQVVANGAHGVPEGGIGMILPMCQPGNSPGAKFWIDQIRVLDWLPPVPVESRSWGEVRALFRN